MRKEYAAARWALSAAIEQHPGELGPRVVLSHVLLQEAKELAAAERAPRGVLAPDPDHREAKHDLGVLLAQRATAGAAP